MVVVSVAFAGCASAPESSEIPQGAPIAPPVSKVSKGKSQVRTPSSKTASTDDSISLSQAAPTPARVAVGALSPRSVYRLPKGAEALGIEIDELEYDFPVRINSQVESWIAYFTGRGRDRFETWLKRSEYMVPEILRILREEGLPEDLIYLSLIESGFSFHATSHAEAVGPWQFIPETGRRYGLRIDWWVDERRDVRKSTRAAARYLRDLFRQFGNWELAAAGYNAGENRVERAIRRFGIHDFWVIGRTRELAPETRQYVPKIIAAALLAKNRKAFGFDDRYPQDKEEVWHAPTIQFQVQGPVDLLKVAQAAGVAYGDVKRLNPEILRWCSSPAKHTVDLRLPAGARTKFERTYLHPGFSRAVDFREYRVRAGDTLSRIARRFGVATQPIRDLNRLGQHTPLPVGRKLLLPIPAERVFELSSADGAERTALTPIGFQSREQARADSHVEGI